MNIFITNKCPVKSAKFLDTKRVNKMILESAQMLSTAIRYHGYEGDLAYKITHKNHPSNIWVRENRSNYNWLLNHFNALANEYHKRRGHWHKSYIKLNELLTKSSNLIPDGPLTPFVNCAANISKGVSYKHIEDTCLAYQLYLNDRWDSDKIEPTWR